MKSIFNYYFPAMTNSLNSKSPHHLQELPGRLQRGGEGAGHPGAARHRRHGDQREARQAEHPDLSLPVLSQVRQGPGPGPLVPAQSGPVKKCGIEVTPDILLNFAATRGQKGGEIAAG